MAQNNEDREICGKCGGGCCKRSPGIFSPGDVGAPVVGTMRERIHALLTSGIGQLDWWEGDPRDGHEELGRCLFLRAAILGEDRIYSPSWGGCCAMLKDAGCSLPFGERPANCRELVPRESGRCHLPKEFSKRAMSASWAPYQTMLKDVGDSLEDGGSEVWRDDEPWGGVWRLFGAE